MRAFSIDRIAIGFSILAGLSMPAAAATETVLYSFSNSGTGYPLGTLTLSNGSLYGTGSGDEKSADGQVFKLTNSNGGWKEHTLLTFDGTNGSTPYTGPIRGSDGVYYGTTSTGDKYNGGNVYTLYKSGGKWVEQTIWAFGGAGDGAQPACDLVIDKSGNIFGTTYGGGAHNVGTVFELSNVNGVWGETVIHSFGGSGDGWEPYAGLLMAGADTFYGTTIYGSVGQGGDGTVFKLSKSNGSWKEKVLYTFTGGADGGEPFGALIQDKNSALYGTTYAGGVSSGYSDVGTVFMLSRSGSVWKEKVLHNFGAEGDGFNPLAGLRWGPSGQLYGTTGWGGLGDGIVFELAQSGGVWNETILHSFGGQANGDGSTPYGAVTLDKDGSVYGSTNGGGIDNLGTVWEITP